MIVRMIIMQLQNLNNNKILEGVVVTTTLGYSLEEPQFRSKFMHEV